jgi:hypothetical protein
MTNVIHPAVLRIQAIALALTSVQFKSAPNYPIENADPFPMSVAYLGGGEVIFTNKTTTHFFPTVNVEFHFSRVNLKDTYNNIDLVAEEFCLRLAGDPTLNGQIVTVIATEGTPLPFTIKPFDWGKVVSQCMLFAIPIKTLQAPQATA